MQFRYTLLKLAILVFFCGFCIGLNQNVAASKLSMQFESSTINQTESGSWSIAALAARQFIAQENNISLEQLIIIADHPALYPNLNRNFQVVTIMDTGNGGQPHKLLVDLTNGNIETEIMELRQAEEAAYIATYGKLHPSLYQRLQGIHVKGF